MRRAHQDGVHLLSAVLTLAPSHPSPSPVVVEVAGQTLVACRRAVNAALLD